MAQAPDTYDGREQSYIKHRLLESYLEALAYRWLSRADEFVYVDGFSGPWESRDAEFKDTSFKIAIDTLRKVRNRFLDDEKDKRIRCFLIEKRATAFKKLKEATSEIPDIEIQVAHGNFEDYVPTIQNFVGQSFSFIFIDPTGWTGFDYAKIWPLLRRRRSETLVNIMYDFINRAVNMPDQRTIQSLAPVLGGLDWESRLDQELPREAAVMELARSALREAGDFEHVPVALPILRVHRSRTHFYLAYGTHHPTGLRVFRDVEQAVQLAQDETRSAAQQARRIEQTNQTELFGSSEFDGDIIQRIDDQKSGGEQYALELIERYSPIYFRALWPKVLEEYSIRHTDIAQFLGAAHRDGRIRIQGLRNRERIPKDQHQIFKA